MEEEREKEKRGRERNERTAKPSLPYRLLTYAENALRRRAISPWESEEEKEKKEEEEQREERDNGERGGVCDEKRIILTLLHAGFEEVSFE